MGERAARAGALRPATAPVSSDELVTLAPGARATVGILAHLGWNRSGVVFEQGARYRNSLPLTGGQFDAALAYDGLVPFGQFRNKLVGKSGCRSSLNFVDRGV